MPYEVTCPADSSVSVLKSLGEVRNLDDKLIGYDHIAQVWTSGDVIPDDEVSPVVVKLLDEGDEHVNSILRRVPDKQAKSARAAAPVEEPAATAAEESPLREQVDKNATEKPAPKAAPKKQA